MCACAARGHALSPRSCLLGALPPRSGRGPHLATTGALLSGMGHSPVPPLLAVPGGQSSGLGWGLGCCNCLLTALLFSGHTASGWISHPTSDSEKGNRGLKWVFAHLSVDPAIPDWILSWSTLTVPQAKAPASSLSHSAPAASPGPGSLSTALALRMGTETASLGSSRKRGAL